jgi:hypothetical protein
MSQLFASGHIVDLILVLVALEALLLARYSRRAAPGLPPWSLLLGLVPGIALLGALRASLRGATWPLIALCLTVALVAHLIDLRQRIAHG